MQQTQRQKHGIKVGGYQTGSSLVKSIAALENTVYYILNEDSIDYIGLSGKLFDDGYRATKCMVWFGTIRL